MKKISILIVLISLSYVLAFAATAESSESIFRILDKSTESEAAYNFIKMGYESYNEGDYNEAIMFYDLASSVDHNSYASWAGKTLAYNKLGDNDEAIKCYNAMLNEYKDVQNENELNIDGRTLSNNITNSVNVKFLPALVALITSPEVVGACIVAAGTIIAVYLQSEGAKAEPDTYCYNCTYNYFENSTIPANQFMQLNQSVI